jgi:phytoene synthase
MMALIMEVRDQRALARACELGVAMQLTNIARDVGEDARRGRVYLPDELLAACGTSRRAVLEATCATWPIREAVRRLLGLADDFYRSADRGVALLPPDCRLAIAAARHIYAAIGEDLAAHHHDSVTRRAHTSTARKVALLARAAPLALGGARGAGGGPADALLTRWIEEAGVVGRGTSSWT